MNKKAFSLIEMAIVLTILGVVIGTVMSMVKITYTKDRTITTKHELFKIKNSIIGYVGIHGKLPSSDTTSDGVGEGTGGIGDIPYIDLQVNSKDRFGMVYQYDVNDSLLNSNSSSICDILTSMVGDDIFPRVQKDDGSSTQYPVAAVIISKGKDKVLTGENESDNRVYEMETNSYNETSNDDLVMEITANELWGRYCDNIIEIEVDGDCSATTTEDTNLTINVYDTFGDPSKIDIEPENAGCQNDADTYEINSTSSWVIFRGSHGNCGSDELLIKTYLYLYDTLDENNNSIINVINNGSQDLPTLSDD